MRSPSRVACTARVALSGLLLLPQSVAPATITVQGACTLADAISAANRDAPTGGCKAGSGADTIVLTSDVTLTSENNPDNGLPQVESEIRIRGNEFKIERASSAPAFRIFDVLPEGTLTLEDVTISNGSLGKARGAGIRSYGDLTLENSTVSGNESNDRGGGLFVQGSIDSPYSINVSLVDSTVRANSAKRGAGVAAYEYTRVDVVGSTIADNEAQARGGGLLFDNSVGTITSSTIANNSAASGAGVRAGFYTYLTIADSTIAGNESELEGGGLFAFYSGIELVRSRVEGNSAARGGGVYFGTGYGELEVISSTISGNRATEAGGGAFLRAIEGEVEVTLSNSTLSGNSAPTGGGIYLYHVYYRNQSFLLNSTITQNSAATGAGIYFKSPNAYYHLLRDSVVAGNDGPNCAGDGLTDGGGNFDDDGTCEGAGSIAAGVDFDTELAENGGPTPTHALFVGSVAVDAAGECFLDADQRGFARDGACDSGSFELVAAELGASARGVSHRKVICKNLATRKTRRLRTRDTSWLCDDLGVPTAPGERVRLTSRGIANGVIPVGGSISGLGEGVAPKVSCRNQTTGKKVSFTPSTSSWDCEAQGLDLSAGDSIKQKIRGRV